MRSRSTPGESSPEAVSRHGPFLIRLTVTELQSPDRRLWWLLLPCATSVAPWIFWFAVVSKSSNTDLEGDLLYAALLGIISFIVTGPLASAQLRFSLDDGRLSLPAYVTIYYLISLPTQS